MANVTVTTPKNARRAVVCPMGCEYSADKGDYFMARSSTPLTCEHFGDEMPCDLVERVFVTGTDDNGRPFGASGWVTVKECVTVGDL